MHPKILTSALFVLSTSFLALGNTFDQVYTLLKTNCSGASGCHSGAGALVFNVDDSKTDLWNSLVNAPAINTAAAEKGHKLVDPGHPYRSFLLKKIGSDFDSYLHLGQDEGDLMPDPQTELAPEEIELVRQWIMFGAPQTGTVIDYQMLKEYYTDGGIDFIQAPPAPNVGEGMQVRNGPIFLKPGQEEEYMKKYQIQNTETLKVFKTDGYMAWQSHHLLLFKFNNGASGTREGLRNVPLESFPFNGNAGLTGAWQYDNEFELPNKTAFYWEPNTVLDFDYHIKNYSTDEILPADFYLNIYFDTENDRTIEMHAELVNNLALFLPQGVQNQRSTHNFNEDRYIHMISSHTHKYGTDYDIFVRESNGGEGDQIYEGFFNEDYSFNQGFYDWEHPAIRYFSPLKKASHGLIYDVTWDVREPFVTFGLTTDDEMMLFTYLYTKEPVPADPVGIKNIGNTEGFALDVMPNPFNQMAEINYTIKDKGQVKLEVFDLLGKKIETLVDGVLDQGDHSIDLNGNNEPGVYFITLTVDGQKISTRKVSQL